MSFDHPALAFGALLAALPPLLHLLDRRKPRPMPFAAIDFLLRAKKGGARRFRLRRLLLMLARMAILAAIPLALARPHRASAARAAPTAAGAEGPKATALVLDGSGSMRFRKGGKTLFDLAREEARHRLAELGADEPATVVLCAAGAPNPPAPTDERAMLLSLIDRATAGQEPAELSACIERAAQALAQSDVSGKRIVVFGDLQQTGWDLSRPPPTVATPKGDVRPELEVVDVAEGPMPNLALSDLSISPAPSVGPHGYQFSVVVHNYAAQPANNVPVALEVSGQVVARGFCDLQPFGSQRKTLGATLAPGTVAEGQVSLPKNGDGLSDDDAIAFAVPVPRQARVLLVDGSPSPLRYLDEAFFVQTALEGAGGSIAVQTVDAEGLTAQRLDQSEVDVVALLNVRDLTKDLQLALHRFVENGGGLLIAMGDRIDPEVANEALGTLLPSPLRLVKTAAPPPSSEAAGPSEGTITAQAPAHFTRIDFASPLFGGFSGGASEGLLDTRIFRYVLVEPPAKEVTVLASYDDGAPAMLLARRKLGQVLFFTSSLAREWTDWPIRTSFVPVTQQAVLLLAHLDSQAIAPIALVGASHRFPPGDPIAVSAKAPSGESLPIVQSEAGERSIARLPEVGLTRVKLATHDGRRVEGNERDIPVAFNPRESDTRRLDPAEITARYGGVVRSEASLPGGAAPGFPRWTELLVLGLLCFLCEALLGA